MPLSKTATRLILTLLAISTGHLFPAFAEAPADGVEVQEARAERKLPFRGFGFARGGFRDLCDRLEADGRRDAMLRIAEANTARDEACVACRSLFLTLSSSCSERTRRKPPATKPRAAGEDSEEEGYVPSPPTPRPLQREPSAAVIDAASLVFRSIAERERDLEHTVQAVGKLVFLLRDSRGKTKGEEEYMRILAEYAIAPFGPYIEQRDVERRKDRQKGGSSESDRKAADDLFAF